jgi:WD40 repeat protein
MKRFWILFGALLIMQIYASLADSANDTVWTRMSHSIIDFEFSPTQNYFLSLGSSTNYRQGVIIFNTDGDTIKVIYESDGLEFRNSQGIWDAHFSQDGRFLVVIWEYEKEKMSRGMLEIFETDNWTSVKRINVPGDVFSLLAAKCLISPDNRTIAAKTKDGLYFYDFESGELLRHVWDYGQDLKEKVSIVKFTYSFDGQHVYFTSTDNKLRFLNTQTYQIDYSSFIQYGRLTLSKSGNMIAIDTGKEELSIINTKTKEIILSIPVTSAAINSMVFSPDERYLVINLGHSKVIKIYDLQTGKYIFEYTTVPSGYALNGLGISYGQKYIVSSSGYIFLYKFLPTTGVEQNPEPKEEIIYPNPTIGIFSIQFNLPTAGLTNVQIYDNTGKNVKQVFQGHLESGKQNITSDIRDLKTGNYFIKVSAPGTDISFKLIINR